MKTEKFNENLYETYNGRFSFIEEVLDSCTTVEQVESVAQWAFNIMDQYYRKEKNMSRRKNGIIGHVKALNTLNEYFGFEKVVLAALYGQKIRAAKKQEKIA